MVAQNRSLHSISVTLAGRGVACTMMGLMFACEPHTIGYQLIANLHRSPNLSISAATVIHTRSTPLYLHLYQTPIALQCEDYLSRVDSPRHQHEPNGQEIQHQNSQQHWISPCPRVEVSGKVFQSRKTQRRAGDRAKHCHRPAQQT